MSTAFKIKVISIPHERGERAKMADPFGAHGNFHVFRLMQQRRVDTVHFNATLLQLRLDCFIGGTHCWLMPEIQWTSIRDATVSGLDINLGGMDMLLDYSTSGGAILPSCRKICSFLEAQPCELSSRVATNMLQGLTTRLWEQ